MMLISKYRFCNCCIELKTEKPLAEELYFSRFRVDSDEESTLSFNIIKTDALPPKSGKEIHSNSRRSVYTDGKTTQYYTAYFDTKLMQYADYACRTDDKLYIAEKHGDGEMAVFDALDIPSILLENGAGILHCSYVDTENGAVLFTGVKQVGKSTQAALWEKYRGTDTVNGDRAGITIEDGKIFANGVPFCGTSDICKNKKVPVKAIVCLSKSTENKIEKLSPLNAFMALINNFSYNLWDSESVDAITAIVKGIVESAPVYSYSCCKDETAVDFLEKELFRI